MTLEGTILNGAIVLDDGPTLPEGARVRVDVITDADEFEGMPPGGSREEVLASLRESIEDMKAGRTRPFEEALAEIETRYNLNSDESE